MVIVERKLGHSGGSLTITLPVWFVKHHRLKAKEAVNVHYNIDNSLTITARDWRSCLCNSLTITARDNGNKERTV